MYVDGYRISEIARKLTEEKVETPQLYNLHCGRKIHRLSEFPELWERCKRKRHSPADSLCRSYGKLSNDQKVVQE